MCLGGGAAPWASGCYAAPIHPQHAAPIHPQHARPRVASASGARGGGESPSCPTSLFAVCAVPPIPRSAFPHQGRRGPPLKQQRTVHPPRLSLHSSHSLPRRRFPSKAKLMSSTPTSAPAAVTLTDIHINRCWSKIKIERACVAVLEQQFSGSFIRRCCVHRVAVVCKNWQQLGSCKFGDACRYAQGHR